MDCFSSIRRSGRGLLVWCLWAIPACSLDAGAYRATAADVGTAALADAARTDAVAASDAPFVADARRDAGSTQDAVSWPSDAAWPASDAAPQDAGTMVVPSGDGAAIEDRQPVRCERDEECEADRFCRRTAGRCGEPGECTLRPIGCSSYYMPVCGCDGVPYLNECSAALAGASVRAQGTCRDL